MAKSNEERKAKLKPDNSIILYQNENGITNVSVRFSDEDLWLGLVRV